MRTLTISLALALAALLAGPLTAMAEDDRPMHGRFSLALTSIVPDCGPGSLRLTFDAAGIATHFGRMTGSATNCTSAALATDAVPIWDGVATYVAADGSSVTTHYAGSQAAPAAGTAAVVTAHTVVAGTGRFAGATGSWTSHGTIDYTTGSFSATLAGSIDY